MTGIGPRTVHAPRGGERSCKGWTQEAALRMLMNNLDPDVAENPDELVVYGGRGKAARSWDAFDAIVRHSEGTGGRRNASGSIGKAGRGLSDLPPRPEGPHRQCQSGRTLGNMGPLP